MEKREAKSEKRKTKVFTISEFSCLSGVAPDSTPVKRDRLWAAYG